MAFSTLPRSMMSSAFGSWTMRTIRWRIATKTVLQAVSYSIPFRTTGVGGAR